MTRTKRSQKSRLRIFCCSCSFIIALIAIALLFNVSYCGKNLEFSEKTGSSPIINKEKISRGYTLLTTFGNYEKLDEWQDIHLVDLFGKPVHEWKTEYAPFYAVLKKNGNLVVALIDPANELNPGGTGIIQELDWSGNVLWEYKNENLKLDFDILPNGNVAAVVAEKVPANVAEKIKGGFPDAKEFQGDIFAEAIIEINKAGKIAWTWHAYQHLDPDMFALNPLSPRKSWTHANSIKYVEKDPIGKEEAFLVSLRNVDRVVLIKKKDGSILWNSPESMLSYQHDATLLSNGNILVFDNNMFREPLLSDFRAQFGSRAIEIDPRTNRIAWEFNGGNSGIERARFIAELTGGAQRLENGNTLIVNGPAGYLFEATPKNEIVWELINPFAAYTTGPWPYNSLFKARRYSEEEINWPEKLEHSLPELSLVCNDVRDFIS